MPILLQINSTVNVGSTGRIAEQIGALAIDSGWESHIAYGRNAGKSTSNLYHIGSRLESFWHGIITLLFDKHCFASRKATKRLIRYIENIKPDVIHLHNIHGYYINIKVLFAYLSKADIPVVWTLHDCWSYTGHCTYYSNINCYKWLKHCVNCPKRVNYPKSLFFDCSYHNFDLKKQIFNSVPNLTLVPVSEWLGHEVQKSFFSKKKLQIITNGVDINLFCPKDNIDQIRKKYGVTRKYMLLGVATAWGQHKGWNDYIKLSQLLSDDYQIVMVGVPEKLRKLLPDTIISIHRTENINELADLYSAADIVLNLSNQESFGLTTIEGMACGTPGIVYNCTASPELITSETGYIVTEGSMQELIDAINTIVSKGRSSYSNACRNRAVEHYDIRKQYAKYIELYNTLI